MLQQPSLLRHLAVILYESLLMMALLGLATLMFVLLFGEATHGLKRHLLQVFLWTVAGAYFIYCWYHSGQTLAMKTWRVKLVRVGAAPHDFFSLLQRYCLASFSLLFFGAGFFWAIIDREQCFLHDRLLGYRLILESKN